MGFLDSMLRRAVSRAVDTAVDSVMDSVLGKKEQTTVNVSAGTDSTAKENAAATKRENCSGERLLRQRIEEIAAKEKPEYELRQKVSTSEVNAPKGAKPFFDYGFYRDGALVAAIMILDNNNAYCRRNVRLAQQACRDQRVGYMNFMSYMMNRPEYISKQLDKNLQ